MPTITERSDLCDFLYTVYEEQYDFQEMDISKMIVPERNLKEEWLSQWKEQFYCPYGFNEEKTYNWFMEKLEDQFMLISNKVLRQCLLTTVYDLICGTVGQQIRDHIEEEIAHSSAQICSSLHL
jgi:hypothetical protein